jgi:hypothetical protein
MGAGLGRTDRHRRGAGQRPTDPEQAARAVAQLVLDKTTKVSEGTHGTGSQHRHQETRSQDSETTTSDHSLLLPCWAFQSAGRA